MTDLTKEGIQASSSSYHVYGETKQSTDQTGNPFAYNGEARDVTGLDYLRARYYDSQAGTFLTEDSYQGDLTDPLSQNRYTYVQNNPVNYTDPSGHFSQGLSVGKAVGVNIGKLIGESIGKAVATVARKTAEVTYAVAKQTTGTANSVYNAKASASQYVNYQKQDVDNTIYYQRKILNDYTQATENVGTARIREAKNIFLNWNNALAETLRHVCSSKAIKGQDVSFGKQSNIDTSYQTGIKDIYRHDLKNVENSHIDEMSMSELQDSYGGVISSYISFLGTGYFNPLGDPTNRVVIERYKTLKAEEEEKVAQHKNELKKFHYLNVYEEIRKTGKHPNGTPASNFEKKIAPYVSLIPAVQMGASIFASKQIIKYSDSLAGSQNKTIDLDLQTIDKLSPRDLAKMSKEQLTKRLPEDWTVWDNKGYVHYKDSKDTIRIRLDPPDKTTTFSHMHVYDENRRLLDIDGNIVDKKSPAGHIPWSD